MVAYRRNRWHATQDYSSDFRIVWDFNLSNGLWAALNVSYVPENLKGRGWIGRVEDSFRPRLINRDCLSISPTVAAARRRA